MLRNPFTRLLVVAIFPALIVYIVVLSLSAAAGIQPGKVLTDLMQTCDFPVAVGMLSNFGFLLWAAAAAISLFVSLSGLAIKRDWCQLLLVGGIFSTILCLDDLFLLHDRHIGPDFLYTSYAILALFILLRFRKLVIQADGVAFLAAAMLLGLSIVSDKVQDLLPIGYATVQLFEEGFKFVGIACWLAFWWQASLRGATLQAND